MAGIVTFGLSSIEFSDIAEDGGCGTDWEQLGYTNEGSATLETEDPDETEFKCEELDDPVDTIAAQGKTTLTFELLNPALEIFPKVLGGEINDDGLWEAPGSMPVIKKSVKIIPRQGFGFVIPCGKVVGKISAPLSKTDPSVISVTVTALIPEKDGVPKLYGFNSTTGDFVNP